MDCEFYGTWSVMARLFSLVAWCCFLDSLVYAKKLQKKENSDSVSEIALGDPYCSFQCRWRESYLPGWRTYEPLLMNESEDLRIINCPYTPYTMVISVPGK